jgi:hypothetical protein
MKFKVWYSSLNPPVNAVQNWACWLERNGFTGSLKEMEQAYIESKGYETWSEYFMNLGFYGLFQDQCRDFWMSEVGVMFWGPLTRSQRLVHYLATTQLGIWYIQKYLGMKGRIAA